MRGEKHPCLNIVGLYLSARLLYTQVIWAWMLMARILFWLSSWLFRTCFTLCRYLASADLWHRSSFPRVPIRAGMDLLLTTALHIWGGPQIDTCHASWPGPVRRLQQRRISTKALSVTVPLTFPWSAESGARNQKSASRSERWLWSFLLSLWVFATSGN